MLSEMRKHSRSTIIYVLFGIIILAFIFTFNTAGPGGGCGAPPEVYVAEVNGAQINTGTLNMGMYLTVGPPEPGRMSPEAMRLQTTYERTRFLRANPPGDVMPYIADPEEISPLKYRRVMDDLVETFLVSDVALDMGMDVPEEELAERLYRNPWLRDAWYDEEGRFQKNRFQRFVLYALGTSPAEYEAFLRREILREYMIRLVTSQVSVPEADVEYRWRLENDKVNLAFVEVDPELVARTMEVSPADVQKTLAERADEISGYYEKNRRRYEKEERARIHGIFFQAPLLARIARTEDAEEKAKLEAEREAAQAKATEVLAEALAAAPAAAPAAATPAAGADPTAAPAPAVPERFVSVETFEKLAGEHTAHLATKDTGGRFDGLRPRSELAIWPFGPGVDEAVFDLDPGQVSEVLEVPNGFWLVRLDESVPAEKRSLDQVRPEIARILVAQEKAVEAAKAAAESLRKTVAAAADADLEAAVASWNQAHPIVNPDDDAQQALNVRETGPFALASAAMGFAGLGIGPTWGTVPMIGHDEELAKTAFSLTSEAPVAGKVFEIERGDKKLFYVVQLVEKLPADPESEDAQAQKEGVQARLEGDRKRAAYLAWYRDLLAKAGADGRVRETEAFQALVAREQQDRQAALERLAERQGIKLDIGGNAAEPAGDKPADDKPADDKPADDKPADGE